MTKVYALHKTIPHEFDDITHLFESKEDAIKCVTECDEQSNRDYHEYDYYIEEMEVIPKC